jgi:hypothetical protein
VGKKALRVSSTSLDAYCRAIRHIFAEAARTATPAAPRRRRTLRTMLLPRRYHGVQIAPSSAAGLNAAPHAPRAAGVSPGNGTWRRAAATCPHSLQGARARHPTRQSSGYRCLRSSTSCAISGSRTTTLPAHPRESDSRGSPPNSPPPPAGLQVPWEPKMIDSPQSVLLTVKLP